MNLIELIQKNSLYFDVSKYILSTKYRSYLDNRFLDFKNRDIKLNITSVIDSCMNHFSNKYDIRKRKNEILQKRKNELLWCKKTSGTTGRRTTIYYNSAFYFEFLYLTIKKILHLNKIDIESRCAVIVNIIGNTHLDDEIFLDPCTDQLFNIRLSFDERDLESVKRIVNKLVKLQPFIITIKPSIALSLIIRCQQLGISPTEIGIVPELIISSGQYLYENHRKIINDFFKCKIINAYITTEAGLIANEITGYDCLFVDESTISVCNRRDNNEILVSTNCNPVMPLLNYSTGDYGVVSSILGNKTIQLTNCRVPTIFVFSDGFVVDPTRFDYIAFEIYRASDYQIKICGDNVDVTLQNPKMQIDNASNYCKGFFGKKASINIYTKKHIHSSLLGRYEVIV